MLMLTRRQVLTATAGGFLATPLVAALGQEHSGHSAPQVPRPVPPDTPQSEGHAAGDLPHTPVVMPDTPTLPYEMDNGVKVFRLVAMPVRREFAPGLEVNCWGYNGESPGPILEAVEGDRVRILVTNQLSVGTSVHWHGILLPNGMDGVGGLTQKVIRPGQTFRYEFTLRQYGTYMYHPHFDEMFQMGMGMMGMFVVHPRDPAVRRVDRDFALMLNEWLITAGSSTPDPTEMTDFNLFTFNGRVFPGTAPLVAKLGERVRIRVGNLGSSNAHPIHLHGFSFKVTGTDGGPIPESAQWPEVTVNVPTGAARDVEFVADAEGDWALHCHKVHHMMNGMGHNLPLLLDVTQEDLSARLERHLPGYMPMGASMADMMEMGRPRNTIGSTAEGPFDKIDAGGMFTVVKVRRDLTSYADPGWYQHPPGTVAEPM